MENSQFVTDTEIQEYISESLGRLVDLVLEVAPGGNYMAETPESANPTVSGTSRYNIIQNTTGPVYANPYKILAVYVELNGAFYPIKPGRPQDMTIERGQGWSSPGGVRYYFNANVAQSGSNVKDYFFTTSTTDQGRPGLVFVPTPRAVHRFKVQYVPYPVEWSGVGTASAVYFNGLSGWEEYVVLDAAGKCLEKEESDTSRIELRKQQIIDQIRHHAQTRDNYAAHAIVDVCPITDGYGPGPWDIWGIR